MKVTRYATAPDYWEVVGPLFEADPVRHTVALTALYGLMVVGPEDDSLLLAIHQDERLVGATFQIEPWPLSVSALPVETHNTLIDYLLDHNLRPMFVRGPRDVADPFIDLWRERAGLVITSRRPDRLYRLGELMAPDTPGRFRLATETDTPLLGRWWDEFSAEVLPGFTGPPGEEQMRRQVAADRRIGIWLDEQDTPVSLASGSAPLCGMSRIGPVYTPKEHRGRGYASAVTAAVAQVTLDRGARDVLLFADLDNPVSNSIYQRIGFRPVFDAVESLFGERHTLQA
ncbi:GNAT family N-acetyltransferase [Actinokineospora iranica]|nr:GNAT family N-acetyltransferase [Actinokineospora iranica]